ncbi:shikimate 5-dehydrogenase [Nakamurella silvestris]|nr:shikimate 5-dehydrogenase [Nakamurella silvestris]
MLTKDTRLCMSLAARPSNIGTRFHNYLYQALNLDYVYKAFTTTDLAAAIGGVRALGIRGCAVSMPYKEDCIPMVDEVDPSASVIGSVNTIVNDDGVLKAYNTDYLAIASLIAEYRLDPALPFGVLGSGGMAKAVVAALRDAGFTDGTVVARNEATGRAIADQYGYGWAPTVEGNPALLVNATPVGMAGHPAAEDLPVPPAVVDGAQVVFDVVAFPALTPLVLRAQANGQTVITGAEVIALQALEQFVLYTGVRPEAELVAAASAYSRI